MNSPDQEVPATEPPSSSQSDAPSKILLELVSQLCSVSWKSLPITSLVAGVLLWKYLQLIGRPDLFLPSLANPAGLGAFLFGFVLFHLFVIFTLSSPSLYFSVVYGEITVKELGEKVGATLWQPLLVVAIGACIAWALVVRYEGHIGAWTYVLTLLLCISVYFWALRVKNHELFHAYLGGEKTKCLKRIGWYAQHTFHLFSIAVVSSLPILLIAPLLNKLNEEDWWSPLESLLTIWALILITLFPAFLHCISKGKEKRDPLQSITVYLIGLGVMFFVVLMIAPSIWVKIMEAAANEVGVRISTPYVYRVNTTRYKANDFEQSIWERSGTEKSFTIQAFVPFSFGELELVCPTTLKQEDLISKAATTCHALLGSEIVRLHALEEKRSAL